MPIDLAGLEILPQENNYWFVRTEGGQYFETFYENRFIAIGWNAITLEDLKNTPIEVKAKIARSYKFDLTERNGKSRVTEIYNKLIRFRDLKKNDIVVIPSEKSATFAFGIVESNRTYETSKDFEGCEFQKRKRVRWVKVVDFSDLDNVFYKIRRPQHAISNINENMEYVDSVMYDVYRKDEFSHFIVRVRMDDNINLRTLTSTLQDMYKLMELANEAFNLNEDVSDSFIQIALQSPGFFNLKQKGIALVIVALSLGSQSCKNVQANLSTTDQRKVTRFVEQNQYAIDSARAKLDTLNVHL